VAPQQRADAAQGCAELGRRRRVRVGDERGGGDGLQLGADLGGGSGAAGAPSGPACGGHKPANRMPLPHAARAPAAAPLLPLPFHRAAPHPVAQRLAEELDRVEGLRAMEEHKLQKVEQKGA
jgi:hypothetical protein